MQIHWFELCGIVEFYFKNFFFGIKCFTPMIIFHVLKYLIINPIYAGSEIAELIRAARNLRNPHKN